MKARMRMQMVATLVFAGLLVFSSLGEAQQGAQNPAPGAINSGVGVQPVAAASGGAGWSVAGQTQAGQTAGTQAAVSADLQAQPPAVAPYVEQPAADPISTGSDHDAVVGRFGIGFFGVSSIPIGDMSATGGVTAYLVPAPTIGMRFWLSQLLAIEAGLGLGIGSSSEDDSQGNEVNTPSRTAFALHGGVPLALASSKHFVFEVVPELNFGIATGSAGDIDLSGLLLELGARAGAEIHFGFMGLPQLALQGSIGVHFSLQSCSVGDNASRSDVRFGTDVYNSPWSIFSESVSAIYYF